MKFEVRLTSSSGQLARTVELQRSGNRWSISLDGKSIDADAVEISPNTLSILMHGRAFEVHVVESPDGALTLQTKSQEFTVEVSDPRAWRGRRHGILEVEGRQQIVAPMPGKVVRLLVKEGDHVAAGQGLLVVEAMKMQNEIRSPKSGSVERLLAKEGQPVNAGEVLCIIG